MSEALNANIQEPLMEPNIMKIISGYQFPTLVFVLLVVPRPHMTCFAFHQLSGAVD